MKRFDTTLALASILVAATAGLASGDAHAVFLPRVESQNPTGICQSALPVFDGQIRKRPKAVQNEGMADAFITCSWSSRGYYFIGVTSPTKLVVSFAVNDGIADSVSCTAVLGFNDGPLIPNSTKTVALAANGGGSFITWSPSDFGEENYFPSGLVNVSCSLHPGVGVNASRIEFQEDVGA